MPSAHALASGYSPARRRLALVVVAMAFILDLLDSTIVNLAVPSIRAGLGASPSTVQWLVAGYALSFSMLLIIGGRLGDVYGYRNAFLVGVAGFAVTSLICGLARTQTELIIARVLQGAAAAIMAPQVMSMVQLLYRPQERGSVMGLFGTLGGLGASLGPLLGGVLIKADIFGLAWRPIFLINLPVAALALVGGVMALPRGRSPAPQKPDILGAGLVMLGVFLLVFPLIQGREAGWPLWSLYMLVGAAPAWAIYAMYLRTQSRRGRSTLTPVELFKDPAFVAGLAVNLALQAALGGYFLTFSLTLQLGLGLGVLAASLTTLPFSIGVAFGIAVLGRRLGVRYGRRLIQIGLVVLMVSWAVLIYTLQLDVGLRRILLIPVLLAAGGGMGLTIGPLSGLALSRIDLAHAGAASGVFNAAQQLGSALGTSALGVVYFAVQGAHTGAQGFKAAFAPSLLLAIGLGGLSLLLAARLPQSIARSDD